MLLHVFRTVPESRCKRNPNPAQAAQRADESVLFLLLFYHIQMFNSTRHETDLPADAASTGHDGRYLHGISLKMTILRIQSIYGM